MWEGKARVILGPKSGLPSNLIDYSTLADIDFSAKILDSLAEVQKVSKPENWEVLRPYAEKILEEAIPVTHDDAVISTWRARLTKYFASEKDECKRSEGKAKALFEALKTPNPYQDELGQVVRFFSSDIEGGDDINLVLYALKEAFGYKAFDDNIASQSETDDLANRLRNYTDLKAFLRYEAELLTAASYVSHKVPDRKELEGIRAAQSKLSDKFGDLKRFVDSEVKLKAELIGKLPPDSGEKGTLGVLVQEYTSAYATLHDSVLDRVGGCAKEMKAILDGDELKALRIMEGITALKPSVSGQLENSVQEGLDSLFACQAPTRASVEDQLRRGPLHECGISFENADTYVQQAEAVAEKARGAFNSAIGSKLGVFLTPAVRERLEQGKAEAVIAKILSCQDAKQLRDALVKACLDDASAPEVINKYLKEIVVKSVRVADFKPSIGTVEKDQIPQVVKEFQDYLEKAMAEVEGNDDVLPVIQLD